MVLSLDSGAQNNTSRTSAATQVRCVLPKLPMQGPAQSRTFSMKYAGPAPERKVFLPNRGEEEGAEGYHAIAMPSSIPGTVRAVFRNAWYEFSSSVTESPANFSITARAISKATAFSITTLAALTAHTSERS